MIDTHTDGHNYYSSLRQGDKARFASLTLGCRHTSSSVPGSHTSPGPVVHCLEPPHATTTALTRRVVSIPRIVVPLLTDIQPPPHPSPQHHRQEPLTVNTNALLNHGPSEFGQQWKYDDDTVKQNDMIRYFVVNAYKYRHATACHSSNAGVV